MTHNARITGETLSLILHYDEQGQVHWVWYGAASLDPIAQNPQLSPLPSSPDIPVNPCLLPDCSNGFEGFTALEAFDVGTGQAVVLDKRSVQCDGERLVVTAHSQHHQIRLEQSYTFSGDCLKISTRIENNGSSSLSINRMASCLIPAPDWANQVLTHYGDWGKEGHINRQDWNSGQIEQCQTSGRPGFDGGPNLCLLETQTDLMRGQALCAHLAWSGPFRLAVNNIRDGHKQILAEAVYGPGEIILSSGESLTSPQTWLGLTQSGLNALSHIFHDEVRKQSRPVKRLIHFNTWEARYFDIDEASCIDLAKRAANLGVERFILDDGWFKGRRDDTTSLGDWVVDPDRFPKGLSPIVDAVHSAGLKFGLWFEPEMVSPQSDLYTQNPNWVMGYPNKNLPTGRNQLVLNLGLEPVRDYLFESLTNILEAYPVDYIKWDCNRDLYPATYNGRIAITKHIQGLYTLLGRIQSNYPDLEIESCASGGGRIEAGILPFITRFWTSDTTDAIDRVRIQKSAQMTIPPELLGAHIGPSPNPMTGRMIPLNFRILTAFFGHLGLEADPAKIDAMDADRLCKAFACYRIHRHWMAKARTWQLHDDNPDINAEVLVCEDQAKAFFRVLRINTPKRPIQPKIRFAGLDRNADYKLYEQTFDDEADHDLIGVFPANGLMHEGLGLDPGQALTGRLIYLERQN